MKRVVLVAAVVGNSEGVMTINHGEFIRRSMDRYLHQNLLSEDRR